MRLLEALVRTALVPVGASPIHAAASVPRELRKIAKLAAYSGRAWSCWTHGARTWLFTGQMPVDLSRERGAPVMHVDVYDEDGLKDSSGLWMPDPAGKWKRCID